MYNAHRGMMHQAPNSRLTELLDQVRAEFETQSGGSREYEAQTQATLGHQVQEMEALRQKVYNLEQTFGQIKMGYENRIKELEQELRMRPAPNNSQAQREPAQPQPPVLGHGPRDLFGQIMSGAQSGSALAPPPSESQHPPGMPAHLTQGAALNTAPQGQQHPYGAGYQQGPGVNGFRPPQPTASPGPGRRGPNRGPPGPATPQQNAQPPHPQSPRQSHIPTPPPGQHQTSVPPHHGLPPVGNELGKLEEHDLPPQLKKTGDEWFVIYNPEVKRKLEVDLEYSLRHDSVVCCVRFSRDGLYLATGCNRSAQVYDMRTGQKVAMLEDDTVEKEGDLYVRSVCFSPDGRYLATGAEDKIIRVWDIWNREVKHRFSGHEQDIYSLDWSSNGSLIASGSGDKTVRLWSLESHREVMQLLIDDGVTTVAFSPDALYVAAGSLDRSVRVWEIATGTPVDRLEGQPNGHQDSVYSVAFSPTGNEIVSGSLDRHIKMWELTPKRNPSDRSSGYQKGSGRCIRTFEGHGDFVLSVALTPDSHWVLSGSKDRGVHFWDPNTGIAHVRLQGHRNSVISVAPSSRLGHFATGSGDSVAKVWVYKEL